MGCQHDSANSTGDGAFSFSHAHRFVVSNINYHTIMAPQPGLPIPYFSNPDVNFLGVPTGVPEGLPDAANNAKTINLTAETVARFSERQLSFDLSNSHRTESGEFSVRARGREGQNFLIEASADLIEWGPVLTNAIQNGSFDFVDAEAVAHSKRFYRIKRWYDSLPAPPDPNN